MPAFETSQPIELDVDLSVGHIEVVAEDRADAVADVLPTNPERSGDRSLAQSATVEFDGARLRVSVPRRMNLFGRNDSVDLRVLLPQGSAVDIRSAYGAVRLRGGIGRARVDAKYGTVAIERTGDLDLSAPYGEVDVREVGGRLDLEAGHSRTRIGSVAGEARIRAAHGSVDLGVTHGPVDARLSGALTIDTALADVTARSAHGALRIRSAVAGTIRLENGYAEVEVGVPDGTAAWLEASSEHGAVRNELTSGPAPEEAESTVELHLSSSWADVVVRRAAAFA
ncbi:DUF4097 domain-containing protein [uncultured Amnibacterium sp.]|uniref:DUF4097 family beta strand repeat-containing protein n=1 Tax=uncultured Amnibacterium sp. TaxID=1631851 RepID=UPI0035CC5357